MQSTEEIRVAALQTDSPSFPLARKAVLDRYDRLFRARAPDGRLTRRRDAPQHQCVASAYTAIVLSHSQTVAGAFNSELYPSAFALVRPMMEALLKQSLLGEYRGDDDGWKRIPDKASPCHAGQHPGLGVSLRVPGYLALVGRYQARAQRLRARWERAADEQPH